jgi:hypothetical protein
VLFLLLLPLFPSSVGSEANLLLGTGAWALRFGLVAVLYQNPSALWMLFTGTLRDGVCYDLIFVMARMLVDKYASEHVRGADLGLHAMVTLGSGIFVGSWFSGNVAQHYRQACGHSRQAIWLVPAGMGAVLAMVFAIP